MLTPVGGDAADRCITAVRHAIRPGITAEVGMADTADRTAGAAAGAEDTILAAIMAVIQAAMQLIVAAMQ